MNKNNLTVRELISLLRQTLQPDAPVSLTDGDTECAAVRVEVDSRRTVVYVRSVEQTRRGWVAKQHMSLPVEDANKLDEGAIPF